MDLRIVLVTGMAAAGIGVVVAAMMRRRDRLDARQRADGDRRLERDRWSARIEPLSDDIEALLTTAPALAPGHVTDAALRHQTAQIDAGLRELLGSNDPALDRVTRRAIDALRSWGTAFEAASLMHRSDAAPTPGQLETADGLVVARTNELRAAMLGLRFPDDPPPATRP